MIKLTSLVSIVGMLAAPVAFGQQAANRVELGKLSNGEMAAFVRAGTGDWVDWGIEISGGAAPVMSQPKPAQIEVYRGGTNVTDLAAGYQSLQKEGDAVVARAKVADDGQTTFTVEDRWTVSGAVLSLIRKVSVTGTETNAGFYSAIRLVTAPTVKWDDVKCLVPGLLYGDSSHAGGRAPTSAANDREKRLSVREDYLSAPMLGITFQDGNWAAVLDPSPRGDTTEQETTASATMPIIDERIHFGALGAQEITGGGVELGFWLPGTTTEIGGRGGFGRFGRRGGTARDAGAAARDAAAPTPVVRRRYNPVKAGFTQNYQVAFHFDKSDSFPDMERAAWRWAWASLNPTVKPVDVEVMRRTLVDHLADRVETVDDRSGIPYTASTLTGRADSTKIQMSFCGKNLEAADDFLIEGGLDATARGEKLRKLGLAIIDSFVRIVPMSPAPGGSGFDIRTGEVITGNLGSMYLRAETEDMPFLLDAYQREKQAGRDHPEWLKWVTDCADWLVAQQRDDGSWPQTWQTGTTTVRQASGATSYAPVPMMVKLNQVTGDKKYLDSAIKAADHIWINYGSKCYYLGATGNPEIADKESGLLSMEAFLAIYDATKDAKWLQRAEAAGSYAESWIWIWNVPMPVGADYSNLGWKPGVPTIGVNGIGSDVPGDVDQFLDWAVPCYVELYKLTKDQHYLDVARVLLFGTKAMLALPGRTYDLAGPGWQQEHWHLGQNSRGFGAHGEWLPWVSVNHLHGIIGLDQFDPGLYQQLSNGN